MTVRDLKEKLASLDDTKEILVIGEKNQWQQPSVFDVTDLGEVCMRNTVVIALKLKEWV